MKSSICSAVVLGLFAFAGCSSGPSATMGRQVAGFEPVTANDYAGTATSNDRLLLAAYAGNVAQANEALLNGADVNATARDGTTALHFAATYGHLDLASVLIKRGANVNQRDSYGRTPLHLAATWGHSDVTNELLAKGGDPAVRTASGESVLQAAIAIGNRDIIHAVRDAQHSRYLFDLGTRGVASE